MKPVVKLGIGAVLCGVGLFFILGAQRSILSGSECEDCDDELQAVKDEISEEVEGD